MKFKLRINPLTGNLTNNLCCLNCNTPMRKIHKESKIGKQLGDEGWYCFKCKFFFFERDGVMYYCRVKNNPILDTYKRLESENLAIFMKKCPH